VNTTHAANATRLVTLAAALLVTAIEWTGFSEILLLSDPPRIASIHVTDASPDGALPEVVVTGHQARH
jgi:hypothetical protein